MADTVIPNVLLPSGPATASLEFESLRNIVEMVSREDTPMWSNMKKGTGKSIKEEWGTETLGTIAAAVGRSIGYVAASTPAIANRRLDNYSELTGLEGGVSDTMDALDAAGSVNTYSHQLLKTGKLHARQLNKLLFTPQAKSGAMALPLVGTIAAYVYPATFYGAAATAGTSATGTGVDIPTQGTTPADFSTASIGPIDTVLEACRFYNGKPDTIYFSPRMKRKFSKLPDASVAENRQTASIGMNKYIHIGAVDGYLSDFGSMETIVDIDCPNTDIYLMDHSYCDILTLPGLDMADKELGRKGSAREFMIETQFTYRALMPEAQAHINGFQV